MSNVRSMQVRTHAWPLKEPFAIARGIRTEALVVIVELHQDGYLGRGEAAGVAYHGETADSMRVQIESVRPQLEAGCGREDLLQLLPAGGARHALDAALWDLEAKRSGVPVWQLAGVPHWQSLATAITIGIRELPAYEQAARERAEFPWLKVKVGSADPVAAVAAVRRGAPQARLIVDANQSWDIAQLRLHAARLQPYAVDLIEQPLAAGADHALTDYACPIALCADESLSTREDLAGLLGRYQYVNIKLDKVGGLSSALQLAAEARALGLRVMVGCMLGGSISIAPAMVLAQQSEVCDLDGPWLQAEDWADGIVYTQGRMSVPDTALWG